MDNYYLPLSRPHLATAEPSIERPPWHLGEGRFQGKMPAAAAFDTWKLDEFWKISCFPVPRVTNHLVGNFLQGSHPQSKGFT